MFLLLLFLLLPLLLVALWILRAPSSPVQIRDRHLLITGGSSGIGLELAKLAAAEGARKITILARNQGKLQEARESILKSCVDSSRVEVSAVSADVADFQSLEKAIGECGPIDVLVCGHGLAIPGEFITSSVEDLKTMVDINFVGTLHVVRAALPAMVGAPHARSISIFSSQAGQAGIFGLAAYSGTKAAVLTFAQALKQEVFQNKIQVSVIFPPDTDTPGLKLENKVKPEITKLISASSAPMDAIDVAKKSLSGIKAGRFNVACNFDGLCLGIVCSGMFPQTSVLSSLLEIFLLPLMRIVAIFTQHSWYKIISHSQSKAKKYV